MSIQIECQCFNINNNRIFCDNLKSQYVRQLIAVIKCFKAQQYNQHKMQCFNSLVASVGIIIPHNAQ